MANKKCKKTSRKLAPTPQKAAIQHSNEWGIPDWCDAAAYGDVSKWNLNRWRWEFYRRRDDLRAFFDRWAWETYERDIPRNEGQKPDEPGFIASPDAGEGVAKEMLAFGYAGIPNPRIGEQKDITIMPFEQLVKRINYIDPRHKKPRRISIADAIRGIEGDLHEIRLNEHHFAVRFDLDKPLRPQIDQASRVLKAAQVRLHGKTIQRRYPTDKWLSYLRTLDARSELPGASWRRFTDRLYAENLLDRHKDPAGNYCIPPPQAGRDKWEAANALRFNF
ncbi:hypothetical protein M3N55_14590 [Roseibaca sp. V10]|uniref:Uncharacterized protein n=1 Tax=Roseinatronobacter domitianus TaxID=2940293 RepID=A0ABT0M529_9RHOB|nr:hypothetical protein [Roseibaca domitiana]MCL1629960.1 hypothetical protein [Roseibaca domitiana]